MNKKLQHLGIFLVICYLAVFVKLHQTQLLEVEQLADRPDNQRRADEIFNKPRGTIVTADGALLAWSEDVGDMKTPRQRKYPEGELFAQIAGYFSRFGIQTGVESTYNEYLTGGSLRQQFDGLANLFSARENVGHVTVSVRKDMQVMARDLLAGRQGSVVAMDPRDGRLLAFYSLPSFDPSLIVGGPTPAELKAAEDAKNLLAADPAQPLLAHQYQEIYSPGSTFKVVVASSALQYGGVSPTKVYPSEPAYDPGGANVPVPNYNAGQSCGGTIGDLIKVSCNAGFARMGDEIGAAAMQAGAEAFGFNQEVPIDLPGPAKSVLPVEKVKESGFRAQLAVGQNDLQATPLQMAMVAAAVANDGVLMKPHVLANVRNMDAEVVHEYEKEPWLTPLSPENAQVMQDAMFRPVNESGGTGTAARVPGAQVWGKTGTAEVGTTRQVHTWFIGFAAQPGQSPSVAVCVVLLNQRANLSTGGALAAPIAQQMFAKGLEVADQQPANPAPLINSTTTVPPAFPGVSTTSRR